MSLQGNDFLTQYKNISSKLKKRFLRKPNVAEASEQFSSLAKQQQQQECPQYAGFSCLALARCEQTIGNPAGQAQALLHAARLFFQAELQNHDLQCPSFQEYLNAALNCYNHAIRVHIEHKHAGLAASLCLEAGNYLKQLEQISGAITYYQRASELLTQSPLEFLHAMNLTAQCYIHKGDYDSALMTFSEMTHVIQDRHGSAKPMGVLSEILQKCEVMQVLLLLLLQPSPHRLLPEHAELLEKYAWESTDVESNAYIMEDLFLLLQSVVMAHQSGDLESLKALQIDLWSLLTSQQNDLLAEVVAKMAKISV